MMLIMPDSLPLPLLQQTLRRLLPEESGPGHQISCSASPLPHQLPLVSKRRRRRCRRPLLRPYLFAIQLQFDLLMLCPS